MIIGILKEGVDLVNYEITLGWRCIRKEIRPPSGQFRKILENKYETEKQIALKSNRMVMFRNKWKTYEELLQEDIFL